MSMQWSNGVTDQSPDKISLDDQIAELRRERDMRDRVYPGLIGKGRLTPDQANKNNAAMDAAIRTLTWLKKNEGKIRRALG